jgi:MFS family permease
MNGVTRFKDGRRLGRGASFTLLVLANVLMMAAASAPSPIYPLYLQRWGFSVTTLTVVFAVYVAGLLAALLTVGSLSDHLGSSAAPHPRPRDHRAPTVALPGEHTTATTTPGRTSARTPLTTS